MLLSTLKEYLQIPAISGRETKIGAAIADMLRPACDSVQIDPMGNVLACKRGSAGRGRILFTAHMDQGGFFVTHIGENGLLHVAYLGSVVPAAAVYGKVIFENGTVGVLTPQKESGSFPQDEVVIDIGAKDRRAAERRVSVGDFATLLPDLTRLYGNRYIGYPLDDRLGCAVLTELAKTEAVPVSDIWFSFTVQQQVGNRGAGRVAFAAKPDLAIAIDLVPADDPSGGIRTGAGTVLVHKSGSFLSDRSWICRMRELAEAAKIPHQDGIFAAVPTDAAAMQAIGGGAAAVFWGIPARNLHTGTEQFDLSDAKATLALARTLFSLPL